ncbi:MAG: potassium channel family protein [Pseudomonadales bacterium]
MGEGILEAGIVATFLVGICVIIHYEALRRLAGMALVPGRHRWLVLASVFGALLAHVLEIWFFGGAYWLAVEHINLGQILPAPRDAFDYIYFSAMVYTTVGFGDLVPEGPIRMIASAEALMGLALITWSASFSYLQMQRIWRD